MNSRCSRWLVVSATKMVVATALAAASLSALAQAAQYDPDEAEVAKARIEAKAAEKKCAARGITSPPIPDYAVEQVRTYLPAQTELEAYGIKDVHHRGPPSQLHREARLLVAGAPVTPSATPYMYIRAAAAFCE